jgi:hypothetical protein
LLLRGPCLFWFLSLRKLLCGYSYVWLPHPLVDEESILCRCFNGCFQIESTGVDLMGVCGRIWLLILNLDIGINHVDAFS